MKILVVEDNVIAQKVIQITLVKLNCCVNIAKKGEEAIQLFQKNRYDIIFVDLGLPDMTGIELVKNLRAIEKNKPIPIIALTAHYTESDKKLGLAAGIQAFILKPLTKERVEAIINTYIPKAIC